MWRSRTREQRLRRCILLQAYHGTTPRERAGSPTGEESHENTSDPPDRQELRREVHLPHVALVHLPHVALLVDACHQDDSLKMRTRFQFAVRYLENENSMSQSSRSTAGYHDLRPTHHQREPISTESKVSRYTVPSTLTGCTVLLGRNVRLR